MYSLLVSIPLLFSRQGRFIPAYRPDSLCDVRWDDRVVLRGRLIDRVGRRISTASGLVILAVGVLPIAFAGLGLVFLLSFISTVVAAVVSLGLRGRTAETPD